MKLGLDKRLLSCGSRKKKSNRKGKVCKEFRVLRKRSRRINKALTKELD